MGRYLSVLLLGFSLLPFAAPLFGQGYPEGQVLVRLPVGTSLEKAQTLLPSNGKYKAVERLVPELGLFLVELRANFTVVEALQELRRANSILYAQADHYVHSRSVVPNDVDFGKQWNFLNTRTGADVSATSAWDFGTGGKDRDGKELVVAVVDGGMDTEHGELSENLWVNALEIDGNGIDDDGNGYVDDRHGWDAFADKGKVPMDVHGTHVAGIVGARGGNHTGGVGINWDVKIMAVAASSDRTSVVAKGLRYVLAQKKLWLETKGAKGANVVATNSSFGVDEKHCSDEDFPVWNELYDALGKVGILSAAATANQTLDVDKVGDIPTSCTSDYLITVTNTDKTDTKNADAGYGALSIDLGAPGTDIWSTVPGNRHTYMTGTSMASPHVAGAVALLHSVASREFQDLATADPAKAALKLKEILLAGTDPLADLKGVTVTGGRLNVAKSAAAIGQFR